MIVHGWWMPNRAVLAHTNLRGERECIPLHTGYLDSLSPPQRTPQSTTSLRVIVPLAAIQSRPLHLAQFIALLPLRYDKQYIMQKINRMTLPISTQRAFQRHILRERVLKIAT
jgi:hypothetical protein